MLPPDDPWRIYDDEELLTTKQRKRRERIESLPPVTIKWTLEIQGSLIQLRRHISDPIQPEHHEKKRCHVFSGASRMNLLRLMNRIDWNRVGRSTFCTLTYPPGFVQWKYKKRSEDRYQFMRAWEAKCGKQLASIWKVEWKRRKKGYDAGEWVPHLHLAVLDTPWISKEFLRSKWRSLLDYPVGDLIIDVKEITTKDGLARYLAKYISKASKLDISAQLNTACTIGRAWGTTRQELIPWAEVSCDCEISESTANYLRGLFAERQEWYDPAIHGGFTWFGKDDAELLPKILADNLALRGFGV